LADEQLFHGHCYRRKMESPDLRGEYHDADAFEELVETASAPMTPA
jgi:hypothetical protein